MAKNKTFNGGNAEYYENYYINKYFNLFVDQWESEGLTYREKKYVLRKFWDAGTIAAFKIKHLNKIAFAPWVRQSWDIYGYPETVQLINERGSNLIPYTTQVVDKDVVLGWIQSNEKPIYSVVKYYIDRIVNVELILNTNLHLQKMPFLIPVEKQKEDVRKVKDIVDRVINNDIVITVEDVDPALFKAIQTQAPYLIDKLYDYKVSLENELKTILGINNQGKEKREQLQLAEVNANNQEICTTADGYETQLIEFCERVSETLGVQISIRRKQVECDLFDGEAHDGEKPGAEAEEEVEE